MVRRADRAHSLAMLAVALGTVAYWVVYFTSGAVRTGADPIYLGFESAFPLADGYMAVCYAVAAHFLWRGRQMAVPWGIAAGSAMIFLGAMDLLFDLVHGKFAMMTPEMTIETIIIAVCFVFGPVTMARLWRIRDRLR